MREELEKKGEKKGEGKISDRVRWKKPKSKRLFEMFVCDEECRRDPDGECGRDRVIYIVEKMLDAG